MKRIIAFLLVLSFFTASCGGSSNADRIAELEGQVASLEEDNTTLADKVEELNEELEEFDHNNRVIIIMDKEGLLSDDLVLGPGYTALTETTLISGNTIRVFDSKLEADGNVALWLFDNITGEKVYLDVHSGETVFLESSQPNGDGEMFLEYWVCYTNNTYSCVSDVERTKIQIPSNK